MHQYFGEWELFFRLSPKNMCVLGTRYQRVNLCSYLCGLLKSDTTKISLE